MIYIGMTLIEAITKCVEDIQHAKKVAIKYDDGIVLVYRVEYPLATIVRIDYRLNKKESVDSFNKRGIEKYEDWEDL